MKKYFLIAAALFAALSLGFVSCENPDDEPGFSLENVGQDDANSDKENAEGSTDGDGTTPSTPEKPTLIATGDVTDVAENSATFWGRLNADTLWALPNVKWGVEYAYDREAVSQHKHQETTKVNCTAGLQGANMDEFSVTIDGLLRCQTIYYSAYILINDMKYVYGELDSVHIVKLTVESNNSSYGTVTGSGTYDYGTEVTITATPKLGFEFVKWNDGNTDNPRIITMGSSSVTYTATFEVIPMEIAGTENGYAYVDLGLPSGLKWATCNVGATKPEEYGSYFAWGETTTKSNYNSSTYTYSSNPTTLPLNKDAASVNMGGAWRMPTTEEQQELIDKCTWTWTDDYNGTGKEGRIAVGKNGNHIFLPAAGCRGNGDLYMAGSFGFYWSSSRDTDRLGYAYCFGLGSNNVNRGFEYRNSGLSVRGVQD